MRPHIIYDTAERIELWTQALEKGALSDLRDSTLSWMHEFNTYTILEFDTDAVNGDSDLEDYRDSCRLSSIAYLYRALLALKDTSNMGPKGQFESYTDTLGLIDPTYVAEANLKNGLTNIYNWFDAGSLSSSDELWMRAMADSCPYDAGHMVYLSRAVLMGLDTVPTWNENECEQLPEPPAPRYGQEEETPSNARSENVHLSIYPNPNNGILTIDFSHCPDAVVAPYSLSIMNTLGETVRSSQITCGQGQQIDLGDLNNGIYLLSVVGSELTEKWNYKLILLR